MARSHNHHANGIVLADPVFQAFRKQRGLTAIDPLNEAPAVEKGRHLALLFGALEFIDRSGVKRASTSNAAERQLNDRFG